MGKGRWLTSNFLTADSLAVSSAPAGLVGSMVPAAVAGSAELMAQGDYSGPVDRLYTVEIDGTTAGSEVGMATFRWRRSGDTAWAATGIATSASWLDLECGVQVKWIPGTGDDLVKGDRWMLAAARPRGLQALLDGNPNSEWRTTGTVDEALSVFLGEERQATVLVLGHHNLTAGATVTLDQGILLDLDPTQGGVVDRAGFQELACLRDDPVWGLRDGVLTEFPPHTVAQVDDPTGGGGYAHMANPASTNLVEQSQDLADAWWTKTRCGISTPVEGPSGAVDGLGLVANTDESSHFIKTGFFTISEGQTRTLSFFTQPGSKSWVFCTVRYLDAARNILQADTSYLEVAGGPYNGWARQALTFTTPGLTPDVAEVRVDLGPAVGYGNYTFAGDGATVDLYLTGVQLEPLPAAGPYIPTAGAAASRGGETLYLAQTEAVQGALQGAGTLRAEVIFGFDPQVGSEGGLVSARTWFSSLLYYDPAGTIKTRDSTRTAVAALGWSAGQSYELATRWGSADQMQVGADDAWGSVVTFDGDYDADSPARIYLAFDLELGPIYFRRIRLWSHWDAAATPAAVGDAYTQALTVTSPHLVHFMDQTASAWRVLLQDLGNPDGYLRVALAHLGAYFEPSQNYAPGFVDESQAAGAEQATGGSVTGRTVTGLAEYFTLAYSNASPADLASFRAVFEAAHSLSQRRAVPCWLVPDSGQPQGALFGLVGPLMTRRAVTPTSNHRQVELTFQELPRRRA